MTSDLSAYVQAIAEHPLLSKEEEHELGARACQGDKEAQVELVEKNLRLAFSEAKKYAGREQPALLMDLIQEANLGLIEAAKRYDPQFNTRFSTYAIWWIKQKIFKYLRTDTTIRVPDHMKDKVLKYKKIKSQLEHEKGRASKKEIAQEMEVTLPQLEQILKANITFISYEQRMNDESEEVFNVFDIEALWESHQEFLDEVDQVFIKERVGRGLDRLPGRLQFVVERRFGINGYHPHTLQEIATLLDLSVERIRQIEKQALYMMREQLMA